MNLQLSNPFQNCLFDEECGEVTYGHFTTSSYPQRGNEPIENAQDTAAKGNKILDETDPKAYTIIL
ncbi:hypothetical protein [Pedobacter aquatilis]|uniref:hypothetical protein n=1 Tax=Pedobacter aquatilis TaxID=351343 RepID=UPI00292F6605|nr:hypothetical protein [Pedobacter aquatilis]